MTNEIVPDAKLYAEQLKRLAETIVSINFFLSVDETLKNITEQARQIIGAHQSVTSLSVDQNLSQAINTISFSEKYAVWRDYDIPPDGSGIYTLICQSNRPMRLTQAELEAHPAWHNFGNQVDKHLPMRGWLAAPLVNRDGCNIGLLQLSDKYEGEFTEYDETILVQLAQVASVAIENARLYEQVKHNEKRLNEREEELRLILETTQVGVWHENLSSGEVRWSEGLEALLGVEGTEFTGTYDELVNLVHPADRKGVEDSVKRSLHGDGLFLGDFRILCPDKTTRWLAGKGKVSFDENGKPVSRFGIAIDIQDRKEADEKLRASEQRFSKAFNLSPVSMTIISLEDLRYRYVNDSFLQATGYSREEVIGRTSDELNVCISGEDREEVVKTFRQEGRLSNIEFKYQRKDGEIRTGLGSAENITLDGKPCILSVITDITERKRAEEDRDRFFTVSLDMLCLADFSGFFKRLNPAWEKALGYTNEELMSKSYIHFVHPDDREKTINLGKRVLDGESIQTFENRYICKDGSIRWLLWSLTSFPEQQLIYAVAHDITERKRGEQEWKKAEENLRQAQKMDAIGRLAGGVAHDFNNLMTAVIGYSEMALRKAEPASPIADDILEIKKAGERAASLTSQLLAFGRKQMLQPKILNFNSVLENIHKMLRRLIGEHIDIAVIPDANLGLVKADPGQIEQVIVNLAVNARDAMPEGGKLTLETTNVHISNEYAFNQLEVTPGYYVMFAMTDTGCGMDVKTMAKIFEPFYTTKEMGKGIGLGLSMVYGIIKQSGGHIAVYSEPGIGTTVKLYLPRVDEEPSAPVLEVETPSPKKGNKTILLVEDEKVVRDLTAKILRDLNYVVLVAANGNEALELADNHIKKIALVISDLVMPQMGGKELTEKLRLLKPGLKMILMSGYTEKAIFHQGGLGSNIVFLQKPFSYDALAAKVREVLRDEDSEDEQDKST
jgi:two-component system, cell cycle sensor histidine kinase and response regulator CckA